MIPIRIPELGADVSTARIVEWTKRPGEPIDEGEVILVVETDKAAFEIEAEASGVLAETLYAPGDEVPVLSAVGYIEERPEEGNG